MNTHLKTLSILALGGLLAGTAIAGPGDAYARFTLPAQNTTPVSIALFRSGGTAAPNCPMTTEQSKLIPSGNPKSPGPVKIVTGYKYEGCVVKNSEMSCPSSTASCAMTHGS